MAEKDPDAVFKDHALEEANEHIDAVISLIAVSNTPGEYAAMRVMLAQAAGLIQRVRIDNIEGQVEASFDKPF